MAIDERFRSFMRQAQNDNGSGEVSQSQEPVYRVRMLADFKKLKKGKVAEIKDLDLAKWLVSRKYAQPVD